MKKAGIIDPAKVVRTALENAGSISSILLSSYCGIVNKPTDMSVEFESAT
jgi:chaperonin GroEL